MTPIPRPALILGLAGLLPFVFGAGAALGLWPAPVPASAILTGYGAAILAFMGGCLWGFACQGTGGPGWRDLALAVIPALWAFSATLHPQPLGTLAAGFVVLLAIDLIFVLGGRAPGWWLSLRVPLTAGVVACLVAGSLA